MTPDPCPEALVKQGLQALQAGRAERAAALLEQAVRMAPRHVYARHLLGLALLRDGRLDEGMACLERALALSPGDAGVEANLTQAYLNRALDRREHGRARDALADYDRAATLSPASLGVHAWRGALLMDLGRHEEALAAFDRTLVLAPNLAPAHEGRAKALKALGQLRDALHAADRALALDPNRASAHLIRADVVLALGRPEEALADYDWAIIRDPGLALSHSRRADALRVLERHAEALESCDRALALNPDLASALNSRGAVLAEMGRRAEAADAFAAALALEPELHEAAMGAAFALLAQGQMQAGWRLLERRWRIAAPRDFGRPLWLGDSDLTGKTILLHAERDSRDTLQFCRYAPLVKALGARVVLEAQGPLLGVLQTLDGVDQWVEAGQPLPDFDMHCPPVSLPLAFGATLQTIPAPIPYLAADPAKAATWARRLGARQGPRVGLAWSGDHRRNIPLACLAPLNIAGVHFHSLEWAAEARAELHYLIEAGWNGPAITDHAALGDLADAAALIENLDLVIAIDAAIAHLAGAMGKTVWILNRFDACWRWLSDRDDSPWYPTVRLFRQTRMGEWGEGVAAVRMALEREAGAL
jgi:tetratricopeptide (TPR) repeat protein